MGGRREGTVDADVTYRIENSNIAHKRASIPLLPAAFYLAMLLFVKFWLWFFGESAAFKIAVFYGGASTAMKHGVDGEGPAMS